MYLSQHNPSFIHIQQNMFLPESSLLLMLLNHHKNNRHEKSEIAVLSNFAEKSIRNDADK